MINPNADAGSPTHAPAEAYADAPKIAAEISWVARAAVARPFGQEPDREFWLRKAALLDRIALEEGATYAPEVAAEAVQAAAQAAWQFVRYDAEHHGLSLRGADLVTDEDYRAHVRDAYREWRLQQRP
ncbi:hypothetical protein RKE29_00910 [Streptomyces sp. B1866]|uniref:hypothetical protein n=1 Tax=Streptomyces sp. B1866 TaxID=3075431 RepID=UPI0028909215|nr:hypothetical protein [Streptomyces sp. B1866]MDT3395223.1 hypothetical protein [Streptomyces sp. B1866]